MKSDLDALVEKGRQARTDAVNAWREWKAAEVVAESARKRFLQVNEHEGAIRAELIKLFDDPPHEEWEAMQRDFFHNVCGFARRQ